MNNIKGLTALVTGGSKGIGAAICLRLVKEGIKTIIVIARPSEEYTAIIKKIENCCSHDQKVISLNADLSDSKKVTEIAKSFIEKDINIDILVNNAGYTSPNSIFEAEFKEFQKTIEVNLYAPFILAQIFLQGGNKFTHIVNIASTAGIKGRAGWATYSSSKAALIALSEALREELLPLGTRVTCISPGRCATALRKVLAPDEDPSTIMQPEHVADVIVMLLSDTGHFIDSENIVVRL